MMSASLIAAVVGFRLSARASSARNCLKVQPSMRRTTASVSSPRTILLSRLIAVTLTHWGVIRARGADAATFLHNQLTNDFTGLSMSQARLAGYCSAKGRLLASFVAWKAADDEILLACHASVLPATLKRLSMFVLRSQCKLSDASAEVPLVGLAGEAAHAVSGLSAWDRRDVDGSAFLRLPDGAGLTRALLAG